MKLINTFLTLVIAAFLLSSSVFAQLTGTKNIPGDYATLVDAITALNAQGVGTGGVTLNLIAGYPQTSPAGGFVIGGTGSLVLTTTSITNQVIVQGNGNTITAGLQTVGVQHDAIFKIVGADWITLQGFVLQENSGNTVTTPIGSQTMTEYGVAIFLVTTTDGAQNNTIQNNTISLSSAYPNAIGVMSTSSNSLAHGTLEASATSGTNSNNKFYNNTISSISYGIYIICPSITATVFESGIDIGGNSVSTGNNITFGNATTATFTNLTRFSGVLPAGITFRNGGPGSSVRYNTITSNSLTYAQTSGLGGIVTTFGTSAAAAGVTYTSTRSNNTITLTNNGMTATTAIDFGYGLSTGTIISNNNQITINQNSTAAVSAAIIAIRANYASATNTLNSNNITVNQSPTVAGSVTSPVTGITGAGVGTTVNVNENIITFKQAVPGGTASYGAGAMTYIDVGASSGNVNVNSNQLLTTGSTIRSTGTCIGVNHTAGTITVGITINLNIINIDRIATSGTITGTNESSTPTTVAHTITNNTITFTNLAGNTTANGIQTIGGVSATGTVKAINGNTINITGANTGTVIGIQTGNSYGTMNNNSVSVSCGAPTVVAYQAIGTFAGAYTMTGNSLSLISSTTSPTSMIGFNVGVTGPFQIYSNTFTAMNFTGIITTSPIVSGIAVAAGTGNNIYSNEIKNISVGAATSSGSPVVRAIALTGGSTNVYKNKIYGIITNASGTATLVSGITITAGTTNTIFNNLIGDLRAPTSAAVDAIRGVNITSTATSSTINVYYNTVLLSATSTGANFGTSGIFHTASATATTATLNLRNNIIVNNSTAAGTGLTVAYRRSVGTAGTLANYASTSNNNDFFAGTPGAANLIYSDGTSSAQTMAAYKAGAFTAGTIAPRDAASFSENPTFQSTTGSSADFLKVNLTAPTQIESGGAPISGITDDYWGTTRNATFPDVGAFEGDMTLMDLTGPSISYSTLGNVIVAGARTFSNVTITDPSGVDFGSNKPRIYYKKSTNANTFVGNTSTDNGWKWTEANVASSPTNFTIDYSILFGGAVFAGDTIQYFVVAQDLASTPNVGINSGIFANPQSSVNLSAGAFPITGTINMYSIIASISGTVTVGTGGTYATLTGAAGLFADINSKIVSGHIVANIISDITEPGTNALNQFSEEGGPWTLTIAPSAATTRTISGSFAGGLIRLNGADRVTIDGRFSGAGNFLTFSNTSTSSSAVFMLISLGAGQGATNNTIRNCNIFTGTSSTATYGIHLGGSTIASSGADNDNNSILNNVITVASHGIYAFGTASSSSGGLDNLTISGNSVTCNTSVQSIGITLSNMLNSTVSQNTLDIRQSESNAPVAISLETGVNNTTVSGNLVTRSAYTGVGGFGGRGIVVGTGMASSNITLVNNVIYGVTGDNFSSFSNSSSMGIAIGVSGSTDALTTTTGGVNIYSNSVHMYNTYTGETACLTAAIYIGSGASNLNIRNNVFANKMDNLGNTTSKSYAIYSEASASAFSNINYNDYFASGPEGVLGFLTSDRADLTAWRTATTQDVNSIAANPMFTAEANLQPLTGSPLALAGTAISGITTDITGITRHATTPTIGAFEALASASASNNIPANNTSPFSFTGTGTTIQFTVGNTGPVDLTIAVIPSSPGGTLPTGLVNIAPRYWAATVTSGTVTGTYSLTLDITGVPGVVNAATLRLLKRDNASSSWVNLGVPTTISGNLLTWAGLTSFGDFGLGGDSENPLPVELSTFAAVVKKRDVLLTWETQTEMNAHSFEVQRSLEEGIWSKVGEVMAHGNSNSPKQYSLSDTKLNSGQYSYRLKMIDNDGVYEYSKVVAAEISNPKEYALSQNYPNPFNPSTKIEYQLPFDANVTIELYGITGEKIADLINTEQAAGYYTLEVNGNSLNLTSGVYIYRMVATGKTDPKAFVSVKKMLMLK